MAQDKLSTLFSTLNSQGIYNEMSVDEFRTKMADSEKRATVYNGMRKWNIPGVADTFEAFSADLGFEGADTGTGIAEQNARQLDALTEQYDGDRDYAQQMQIRQNLSTSLDDMTARVQKAMQNITTPTRINPMFGFANNPERNELAALQSLIGNLQKEIALPTKAEKEHGNKRSGLAAGLKTADLTSILTAGWSDAANQLRQSAALRKAAKGEPLSPTDQMYVDLYELMQEAEANTQALGGTTSGANIGRGVAGSIPYMTGMIATSGVSGAARAATSNAVKAIAPTGVKNFVNNAATAAVGKAIGKKAITKGVSTVGGAAVGALAALPFQSGMYRNFAEKTIEQYDVDAGVARLARPTSTFKRLYQSGAEAFTDIFTEQMGGLLTKSARFLGRELGSKASLLNKFDRFQQGRISQMAFFGGPIEEFEEELWAGFLSPLLSAKSAEERTESWRQMFSAQSLWETAMTTALMSGGFSVLDAADNAPATLRSRSLAKKSLSSIKDAGLRQTLYDGLHNKELETGVKDIASYDWSNASSSDMANAIDYVRFELNYQVRRGYATAQQSENEYLKRVVAAGESIYYGKDGNTPSSDLIIATTPNGVYNVLAGDIDSTDPKATVIVRDAEGRRTQIANKEIQSVMSMPVSDYLSQAYAEIYGQVEQSVTPTQLQEDIADAQEAGVNPSAAISSQMDEAIEGSQFTLPDGRRGEVAALRPDGTVEINVLSSDGSMPIDNLEMGLQDVVPLIQAEDASEAEAQKIATEISSLPESEQENATEPTVADPTTVEPTEKAEPVMADETPSSEIIEDVDTKTPPSTVSERVPKDEKGNYIYEAVDANTAWDFILEQTDGEEEMAMRIVNDMVEDKEVALKKLEKSKPKGGVSIAEKIAAEKKRKSNIEKAQQELDAWKAIASVQAKRQQAMVGAETIEDVNQFPAPTRSEDFITSHPEVEKTPPRTTNKERRQFVEEMNLDYDNQGNPIDTNGNLIVEEVSSIDEITDEDFINPTRSIQLPQIPENISDAIGANGRPVIIKKNVFGKNRDAHAELTAMDGREILTSALYNPNLVGTSQPIRRPDYRVAIHVGNKNSVVVLDVYANNSNIEIVGWRKIDGKGLERMRRQSEREGGQFLILSPNDGSAAALSALPSDVSSATKDTTSEPISKEITEKSLDVSEQPTSEEPTTAPEPVVEPTTTEVAEDLQTEPETQPETAVEPEPEPEAVSTSPYADYLDMDTLTLKMSDEEFEALESSNDSEAIKEYLGVLDKMLINDENTPFAGQYKIQDEFKQIVQQYGSREAVPSDIVADLTKRIQPYYDLSSAIYQRKYALQDALTRISEQEVSEKDKREAQEKAEYKKNAYYGFLDPMSSLSADTADKALKKRVKIGPLSYTVGDYIASSVISGDVTLTTQEVPKYAGAPRAKWNRMDAQQQAADAERVKKSGTKTIYYVNSYDLGATAYNYARYLRQLKEEGRPELNPVQPKSEEEQMAEEAKARILKEGTSFDKDFELIAPKDVAFNKDISHNVDIIISKLAEKQASGEDLGSYGGFVGVAGYDGNAYHQVKDYLVQLKKGIGGLVQKWLQDNNLNDNSVLRTYIMERYAEAYDDAVRVKDEQKSDSDLQPKVEANSVEEMYDKMLAAHGPIAHAPLKRTFDLWAYTSDDKLRPGMTGIYHNADRKEAVATDAHILVASKTDYDEKFAGKVIGTNGKEIPNAVFPNYTMLNTNDKVSIDVNVENLKGILGGIKKEQKELWAKEKEKGKKPGTFKNFLSDTVVYIKLGNGKVSAFKFSLFEDFVVAMEHIGADKIYGSDPERAIFAKSDKGLAMAMPRHIDLANMEWRDENLPGRDYYIDVSADASKAPEAPKKEETKKPKASKADKPKATKPNKVSDHVATRKAAATARKEAQQSLQDFGEKIEGARKDVYKTLAKAFDDATLQSLIELPFSKSFKRPDLAKLVESGVLREEDALYAEAFMTVYLSTAKPKPSKSDERMARIYGRPTKVTLWAEEAYKRIQQLQEFMLADNAKRDEIIASFAKPEAEQAAREEREYQERIGGRGPLRSPNPVGVIAEVLNRIGYSAGDTVKIDCPLVKVNSTFSRYELRLPDGSRNYQVPTAADLEEAITNLVMIAKMRRGDNDVQYHKEQFTVKGDTPIKKGNGKFVVGYIKKNGGIDYKRFSSEAEAKEFAAKQTGETVMKEEQEVVGYEAYKVRFQKPLDGDLFILSKSYPTREAALEAIENKLAELSAEANTFVAAKTDYEKNKKKAQDDLQIKLLIDRDTRKPQYFVSTKRGEQVSGYFDSSAEARKYLAENKEAIQKRMEELKEARSKFAYFSSQGEPRVGEDYRKGVDATPEMFQDMFGFRGVQFGNWTNARDRQEALNQAYDGFMDLASVLGVSPRALSLAGELGLAFGARGGGSAAAHYELKDVVINLTKTKGAGSLAHEWWHALDNYFARQAGISKGMATKAKQLPGVRPEVKKAFDDIVKTVNNSFYAKRSKAKGDYWGSEIELTARLFGEWVVYELAKTGRSNHFLSRGITPETFEEFKRMNYAFYEWARRDKNITIMPYEEFANTPSALEDMPYPTKEETEQMGVKVRELFDTLQEREEGDRTILFRDTEVEYTEEEEAIIDKAIANGSYLKAPNGQPTNLTPKQWAQVRTKAFKEWFGDWEIVARFNKLRNSKYITINGDEILYNKDIEKYRNNALNYGKTIRKQYFNEDTGNDIVINRDSITEVLHHDGKNNAHIQSIAAIPQMVQYGIYITSAPVEANASKKLRKAKMMHYYMCGLNISGVSYTVKFAVAEFASGKKYYDHSLTEIEKGELLNRAELSSTVADSKTPLSDIKDKRLVSILQTNSSKIVDANGEPKVVEHSTWNEDFYTFDIERLGESSGDEGLYGAGFYFGNVGHTALYGDRPIQAYLNMERPLVLPKDNIMRSFDYLVENFDRQGLRDIIVKGGGKSQSATMGEIIDVIKDVQARHSKGEYDELIEQMSQYWYPADDRVIEQTIFKKVGFAFYRALTPFIENNIGRREFTEALSKAGYDGVVYDNTEWVVYKPNQIKSATDNVGTFDSTNDDIRYREDRNGQPIGDGSVHFPYEVVDFSGYPQISHRVSESVGTESVYVTYTNEDTGAKATVRFSGHENNATKFGDQLSGWYNNSPVKQQMENELKYRLGLVDRKYIYAKSIPTRSVSNKELAAGTYPEADKTIQELYELPVGTDLAQYKGKLAKGSRYLITGGKVKENRSRVASVVYTPKVEPKETITSRIIAEAQKLAATHNVPIEIHETREEITDSNSSMQRRKRASFGWFDPAEGKVHLVLPSHDSVEELQSTFYHEAVAHYGLPKLLGEDQFTALCDNVWASLPSKVQARLTRKYPNDSTKVRAEEYMATIAEGNITPGLFQRIIAFVREAFRKMGVNLRISDNDIAYILWRSKNNLQRARTASDKAAVIAADKRMRDVLFRDAEEPGADIAKEVTEELRKEDVPAESMDRIAKRRILEKYGEKYPHLQTLYETDNAVEEALKEIGPDMRVEGLRMMQDMTEADNAIDEKRRLGRLSKRTFTEEQAREYDEKYGITKKPEQTEAAPLPPSDTDTVGVPTKELSIREKINLAIFDAKAQVKQFQEALAAEGLNITSAMDYYSAENRTSSIAEVEKNRFQRNFANPLKNQINELAAAFDESGADPYYIVSTYALAEHSIERHDSGLTALSSEEGDNYWNLENTTKIVRRFREDIAEYTIEKYAKYGKDAFSEEELRTLSPATRAKVEQGVEVDSLTESEKMEIGEVKIEVLWRLINRLNDETLNIAQRAGLKSREEIALIKSHNWKYYVPLRNVDLEFENLTDPMEMFNKTFAQRRRSSTVFSPEAEGRTTKAADPFGQMIRTGQQFILVAETNKAKQRLLNLLIKARAVLPYSTTVKYFEVGTRYLQKVYNEATGKFAWKEVSDIDGVPPYEEIEKSKWAREKIREHKSAMIQAAQEQDWDARRYHYQKMKEYEAEETVRTEVIDMDFNDEARISLAADQTRIVEVWVNGRKHLMKFKDPAIAIAVNGLVEANTKFDFIDKTAGTATRWLAKVRTQLSPDFIVTNAIRDFRHALRMHYLDVENGHLKGFAKNYNTKTAQAINRGIRGKASPLTINELRGYRLTNPAHVKELSTLYGEDRVMDTLFDLFQSYGGQTGFAFAEDTKTIERDIRREYAREKARRSERPVVRAWGRSREAANVVSEAFKMGSEVVENMSRFATFLANIEAGRTAEEAAQAAKEITVNFNRRGQYTKILGGLYTFFNATMQAMAQVYRVGKENPKRLAVLATYEVAKGFAIAMLAEMFKGDDDKEVPAYTLKENLVIPLPGGKYLKFSEPQTFSVFHGIGVDLAQAALGKISNAEVANNLIHSVLEASLYGYTEGGTDMALEVLIPSIAEPFVDAIRNKNAFGSQIHPEDNWGLTPDSELGNRNTNELIYLICKLLNQLGGGNEVRPAGMTDDGDIIQFINLLDVNPANVEYIINQFAGGSIYGGKFAQQLWRLASALVSDSEATLKDVPMLNRILGTLDTATPNSAYYREKERIENAYSVMNKENKAGMEVDPIQLEYHARRRNYIKSIQKQIDAVRDVQNSYKVNSEAYNAYKEIVEDYMRICVKALNNADWTSGADRKREQYINSLYKEYGIESKLQTLNEKYGN